MTKPKEMFRSAKTQLSVIVHFFEEISEVLSRPKIAQE